MPSTGGNWALTTDVLRITQRCVVLETAGGESELLVWPADRTRWDAATGTIGLRNFDGTAFTLRDGATVSFAGGGDSTAESGVSGAEWAASLDWAARPDRSCPMQIRWSVGDVVPGGAAGPGVVLSRAFPGVEIVCRGPVRLAADACRAWGERLLASRSLQLENATRLILTSNGPNARCQADFLVGDNGPMGVPASLRCP